MTSAHPGESITAPSQGGASARLQVLMRRRSDLSRAFGDVWDFLSLRCGQDELEAWAKAVLILADVNVGPVCLTAYWRVSREQHQRRGLAFGIDVAVITADICRHAGSRAATATLQASRAADLRLEDSRAFLRWWQAMRELASAAPECVESLASRTSDALEARDINLFEHFISVGLKRSAAEDRERRRVFFALEDDIARRLVRKKQGGPHFDELDRTLTLFLTALWGRPPNLRALVGSENRPQPRRANIAGPVIRLPEHFQGIDDEEARHLFRACAAHASAHLVFGGLPFRVGSLKPLQIALVNLIEDARIETLAMQSLPGLRTLWSPYHIAQASDLITAEAIMTRLARALFDPSYKDDHGVVAKGRRLFEAAWARLDDPSISRDIGGLLGNDLGQMRLQFNAKSFVVEPPYRDDGLGLWDFDDDSGIAAELHEMLVEAARIERTEDVDAPLDDRSQAERQSAGRARPTSPDRPGMIIARYPEWDRASGLERRDWSTVREIPAATGDPRLVEEALDAATPVRVHIRQLMQRASVGRSAWLTRQVEGPDLDLDAVIDAGIALRGGELPDGRIFRKSHVAARSVAIALLIDISESTRAQVTTTGRSILDTERVAVAALAEALAALGDPFALLAFASNGHDDVRFTQIKAFAQPYDRQVISRLAGLKSGLSTRLGTALRHSGAVLDGVSSYRKLVIALTDGEPSDVDTHDPLDLVEDARRAVVGLRGRGIDSFGVIVGSPSGSAPNIFGRGNTMPVLGVEDLPMRLSELYFRLSRR